MQTEVDDVATLWEQGPEPFSGMLVFGVGARHETFMTVGITHLVEHLVMSTLPKGHLDCNASVDMDTTSFYATGPRDEVIDFLQRICAGLNDLPVERLAREVGVLKAEGGTSEHPAACWALGVRYGHSGPGLLSSTGPGPEHITADQVQAYRSRHFVRSNAVLAFTGPPPSDLRLDLPDGERPGATAARQTGLPLPAVLHDEIPYPTLSVELPGRAAHRSVLGSILAERLTEDLRHGQGIVYTCGFTNLRLDDSNLLAFYTDGHDDKFDAIAQSLWSTLRDLASTGPSPDELRHEADGYQASLADPRSTAGWLELQARRHLKGFPVRTPDGFLESVRALTAETVRGWAEQGLTTALVGLPTGVDVELDGVEDRTQDPIPSAPPVDGSVFRRRALAIGPLDLRVVAGEHGISQTCYRHTVSSSWDRVVGVASAPGVRNLFLDNSQGILLTRRHLKDAERLFHMVDHKLADRTYEVPENQILGR